jgi:hypothetical protein
MAALLQSEPPAAVPCFSALWSAVTTACGPCPSPRSFHTFTRLKISLSAGELETVAVLIGGRDATAVHGDLWIFRLRSRSWIHVPLTSDTAYALQRAYHTATPLDDTSLLLIGGRSSVDPSQPFNADVIRVRFESSNASCGVDVTFERLLTRSNIGPRAYHGAALLEVGATSAAPRQPVVAVTGGYDGTRLLNVVSLLDLTTLQWTHTVPSPATAERGALIGSGSETALASGLIVAPPTETASEQELLSDDATLPFSPTADVDKIGDGAASSTRHRDRRSMSTEQCESSSPGRIGAALTVACSSCGAVCGCIHASKFAKPYLSTPLFYTSTMPSASPSLPSRDASAVFTSPNSRCAFTIVGGETADHFANSVHTVTVIPPPADGAGDTPYRTSWFADFPGREQAGDQRESSPDVYATDPAVTRSLFGRAVTAVMTAQVVAHARAAEPPEPRAYHTAWPVGPLAIAQWGGFGRPEGHPHVFADLKVFDLHHRQWYDVTQHSAIGSGYPGDDDTSLPAPRASAAAVKLPRSTLPPGPTPVEFTSPQVVDRVLVFGGDDGVTYFNDLWTCDLSSRPGEPNGAMFTLRVACEQFLRRLTIGGTSKHAA